MTTPMNCECEYKVCLNYDHDALNHDDPCEPEPRAKTTFPVASASQAKPDEHVVMWQAGTNCTITSCKAFALKEQAHEDYIAIWQNWLKTQIDGNVPVRNIVRHPFCPSENIPTVEWLKNVDNFNLLRSHLPYDLPYDVDAEYPTEEEMMKYIYGLYHFATIRVCFHDDLEGLPYNLNREMKLLDIYYDWEIDDRLKARIPENDYDLGDIEHEQWKQDILFARKPNELPQLITLKMN